MEHKLALLIATNNRGKQREYRQLLKGLPVQLVFPQEVGVKIEVEETGKTYAANAALKAKAWAEATGLPTLADDSGLEVEALDGAPGIFSARYAPGPNPGDADRRAHLLAALAGKPRPWAARFVCVLAVVVPARGVIHFAEGACNGEIVPAARGEGGFGYDPIFYLPEMGLTMAELPPEEKNRISHRGRATAAIRPKLLRWLGAE